MKEFEKVIQSYADAVAADKQEEAQAAAMKALMLAAQEGMKHPTPCLLLKQKANDCEEAGDWSGAEAAYREVLVLEERSANAGAIAKAQMDLCRLLRVLGRLDEAWEFALLASASARVSAFSPVLAMALDVESFCAAQRGDSVAALRAANEALGIIEPDKLYNLMRAKALVSRAQALLLNGQRKGAEADLASAWTLLQSRPGNAALPGPGFAMAHWWEVKSRLEEQAGNLPGAREAMAAALEYLRRFSGVYQRVALARVLQQASALSRLANDFCEADAASNEATIIRTDLHLPA